MNVLKAVYLQLIDILAISGLVVPQFLNWSFDAYGQRGTLLLVSGICIHNIFGIILMQPIAWHLKQVEVPETEKGMKNIY